MNSEESIVTELRDKLARAADALESIRTYEPDPHGEIDPYIVLRLHNKRQAGDALMDIGAIVLENGKAVFTGV